MVHSVSVFLQVLPFREVHVVEAGPQRWSGDEGASSSTWGPFCGSLGLLLFGRLSRISQGLKFLESLSKSFRGNSR